MSAIRHEGINGMEGPHDPGARPPLPLREVAKIESILASIEDSAIARLARLHRRRDRPAREAMSGLHSMDNGVCFYGEAP